jgi:hypothetical protein
VDGEHGSTPAAGGSVIHRQAVVVVHGMGEQRPGDALHGFINVGLPGDGQGGRTYFSRPDTITDSFEARRLLAPTDGSRPQTEFFEYHWAHLMQGNRLDDLWPTFRRLLLTSPSKVPSGLRVVWSFFWLLILGMGAALAWVPLSGLSLTDAEVAEAAVMGVAGSAAMAALLSYLSARVLARGITKNFVDVVRYLDTSPRSYQVRRRIRKGFIDLLNGLHDRQVCGRPRYDRIVIVAHSLGGYIAYDGISYLWATMNSRAWSAGKGRLDGLEEAEQAAARLPDGPQRPSGEPPPAELRDFLAAQRRLWLGLRALDNPWRVTDLITVGTPMYFADRLYLRNTRAFRAKVGRGELPVCPPISDPDPRTAPDPQLAEDGEILAEAMAVSASVPRFSWRRNRRVLHESAPFAVVRWTNLWFPHPCGIGDWFGGPLARLYGNGIRDVKVIGNRTGRWWLLSGRLVPGLAHTRYFSFPDDTGARSVTTVLREALDLGLGSFHPGR